MTRESHPPEGLSRRSFTRGLAGGVLGSGLDAAWRRLFGWGLMTEAQASAGTEEAGLVQLVERPLVLEPLPHLLGDPVTPAGRHFVRNHGMEPGRALVGKLEGWTLTIDGLVREELRLTMDELRSFPAVTRAVVLQSSGYARREFEPPVRGIPWGRGAAGCARWTGARLKDVLARAGPRAGATYTLPGSEDTPISAVEPFRRGIPLEKALAEETLVAYEMNGEPLPAHHGFPARLVVPGWVGSTWQKWLRRITLVDGVPETQSTQGWLYRIPVEPVAPGTRPRGVPLRLLTSLRIQSMIVAPRAGDVARVGKPLVVTGVAWGGESPVARVEVSLDAGGSWVDAELDPVTDRHAWRRWTAGLRPARPGGLEVWSRAHDGDGEAQPLRHAWNPRGYLGNAAHKVPVQVLG